MPSESVLSSAERPRYLNSLTSLRFFAALHVVVFHYAQKTAGFETLPFWVQKIVRSGPVSVSLFYVLSGFILAYNYIDESNGRMRTGARAFWITRFARIYPLYLIAWLLYAPLAAMRIHGWILAASGVASVTLTQSWLHFLPYWNAPGNSLSVEVFFYLAFPFAAPWICRIRREWLGAFIVACALPSLFFVLDPWPWRWFGYTPVFLFPAFAAGIAAARLYRFGWRPPRAFVVAAALALPLILATCSFEVSRALDEGLLVPLFALLVYGLAFPGRFRFLEWKWMVVLGDASYAMYLLQVPLWNYLVPAVNKATGRGLNNLAWGWSEFSAFVAVLIAVSIATYYRVETPSRRWVLERLKRR